MVNNAAAISTCNGYLFDSVLSTTSFIVGRHSLVSYNGLSVKPNMYIIFVGPPSTGKSQAINTGCVAPLDLLSTTEDCPPFVIRKSTSAGLVSRLSEGDAMLVSSEIYDILTRC